MKNLLNLQFTLVLFLVSFLSVSCNKDKDKESDPMPDQSGSTNFNGQNYFLKNGYYIDGQSVRLYGEADTHYLNFLFMTDGTPVFGTDGDIEDIKQGKIMLMASFFSANASAFKTGNFKYIDLLKYENSTEEEIEESFKNQSFFYSPVAIVDTDGDGNWQEESELVITGGTIQVTGNFPSLTTEFDLTTNKGKALKGKFSGKFTEVVLDKEENKRAITSELVKSIR